MIQIKSKKLKIKNLASLRHNTYFLTVVVVLLAIIAFLIIKQILRVYHDHQILSSLNQTRTYSYSEALQNKDLSQVNNIVSLFPDQPLQAGVIKDVDTLKKLNPLFNKAKNGDMLIIYKDWTMIYDPINKVIVDVSKSSLLQ